MKNALAPGADAAPPSRLTSLRRVRVGSLNGPKLQAVQGALASYTRDIDVTGVEVESGVPEQPVGFEEIVAGARNRACAAYANGAHCDLAVGIEDGLVDLGGAGWVNIGCAALTDGERNSTGFSSGFAYPPAWAEAASRDREPIGALFDEHWARYAPASAPSLLPSAKTTGNVGKLTLGVLPRSEYARHAVLCALVSFLHPELYPASLPAAGVASRA